MPFRIAMRCFGTQIDYIGKCMKKAPKAMLSEPSPLNFSDNQSLPLRCWIIMNVSNVYSPI